MNYVYFCSGCRNLEMYRDNSADYFCSVCGEQLQSLNISAEMWNGLSNEEMLFTIQNATNASALKKPVFHDSAHSSMKVDEQRMKCTGCGAQLPINNASEILVCAYCETRNANPYFSKSPYTKSESQHGSFGLMRLLYDSVNKNIRSLTVTVMETGDKYVLENGDKSNVQLRPGVYNLSFVFGEKKIYKRVLRIYSSITEVTISSTSSKLVNQINITYKDGITLTDEMQLYNEYTIEKYEMLLRNLGFLNVTISPDPNPEEHDSDGEISAVLVDGTEIDYSAGMISREARIEILY